jgi:DNA-binding beta-propeller fold protein YncE
MSAKLSSCRQSAKPYIPSIRPALLRNLALPALVMLGTLAPSANAMLLPGDNLVVDSSAGTDDRGALFAVKRKSGVRTLLSDFGDSAKGPAGMTPSAAAFESFTSVVAVDLNGGTALRGAVYRIDTVSGTRTLLSDFGDASSGPLGSNPSGIAVEATGSLLVIDPSAGDTDHRGRLFRVDAATGARTVLSDFSNATQGPRGLTPSGLAIEASGKILVVDASVMPGVAGLIFKIDPQTGARTIISNFGDASQGPVGGDPATIAVEPAGTLLVTDAGDRFTGLGGGLYRVDAATGARTLLSDFADAGQGPMGASPLGVGVQSNGKILIADADTDLESGTEQRGALFAVDPATGNRETLSDFANLEKGPLGNDPVGVVPVPGLLLQHFKFDVKFDAKHKLLWIHGRFGIDAKGASVAMLKEMIRVQLGSLTQILPPNACSLLGGKGLKCEGAVAGNTFALLLRPLGKKQFAFYLTAAGDNLAQLQKSIPFSLSLGERIGGGMIKLKLKH